MNVDDLTDDLTVRTGTSGRLLRVERSRTSPGSDGQAVKEVNRRGGRERESSYSLKLAIERETNLATRP